jgi:hypothetical protein
MKHVTIAEKSFLVGDDVADLLIRYAALLGKVNSADSVSVRSIGADGEVVEAMYLLNSGVVMMAEGTSSTLPEPDNRDAVTYMEDQIRRYESFEMPQDEDEHEADDEDEPAQGGGSGAA